MLQIIFGDDEHTAADGPYVRLMKTRKWLYLSSAAAIVFANGLYDAPAAKALLKVISAPTWVLAPALFLGLAYLTAQYALLLLQLTSIYDLVVSDRLQTRRVEGLSDARERIRETETALHDALRSSAEHNSRISRISESIRTLKQDGDAPDPIEAPSSFAEFMEQQSRVRDLEKDLEAAKAVDFTALLDSARSAAVQARDRYENLARQDAGSRATYRISEYAIDLLRLIPPGLFSMYALTKLLNVAFPAAASLFR
jgi:hypothetical protein